MDAQKLEMIDIGETEVRKPVHRKRQLTRAEKLCRKKRRRRARIIRGTILIIIFLLVIGAIFGIVRLTAFLYGELSKTESMQVISDTELETLPEGNNRRWKEFYAAPLERPELLADLLTVNEYSRPGEPLPEVKNIFVHYTANAGTTAQQNRSYFQSLAETGERSASAHFVIGYDGEIVQCIPTKEIGYAVMKRNYDSISIECCYLNEDGEFTEETYQSLIELTAWLLHKYELVPEDVLRHYDAGGKNCPKYYVENEDEWQQFLMDLTNYMTEVSKK